MENNKKHIVYLSIGSNLGDRVKNIDNAKKHLKAFSNIINISPIYETQPMGYQDQGKFLNIIIEIETTLTPTGLIIKLQEIEHKMGRIRQMVNGPRNIDIDIIFYNQLIIQTPGLIIPHPRMHKRKFVLKPLSDINKELIHPKLNQTVSELLENLKDNYQIKKWTQQKLKN